MKATTLSFTLSRGSFEWSWPFFRSNGGTRGGHGIIRDPIIRSLGPRAGAEIRCHETTIWLFTPLLVLYRYGEGRNRALIMGCLRIGGLAELLKAR